MALSVDQLLSKAKSLAHKGNINTAAQIYQSVLQRFPKNKRASDGLKSLQRNQPGPTGNQPPQNQINALISLLQNGQMDMIVHHATPMLRRFPNAIALHDFLGIAHMGLHNYDQSIAHFQKALQIRPGFVEGYNNLGAALKAQGHLDAAISNYHKALELKPDYAEAHNNLGIALQETGYYVDAIASFENALHYALDYADAYFNLGGALKETGRLPEAIASFKKGLAIKPNHVEALNHLGNTQRENGQIGKAIENYEKALQADPEFTRAHLNLGSLFKAQGRKDDAIASFKTALRIDPAYAEAYRNYTAAIKFNAEDEYTYKISTLLQSETLSENDQMHLCFALAKVKLDIGQAAEGIALLKTANALRKKELNYDISIDEDLFHQIKRIFAAQAPVIATTETADKTDCIPIFIVGMSRSGTTLVEQIISSHTDVHGAGELPFLGQIMNNIDLNADELPRDIIQNIRTEYFDRLSDVNTDKRFITDKMPANFIWTGFITQAFPEAKIIHTTRSPAAVCWSNFKLYFPANGMKHTFDMGDIAYYYKLYQGLMEFWHEQCPDRIYDINYENLTENQQPETRKLLAYLELDWQDSVMDFHKNTRSVATASNQQVRRKMYTGSSQEWQKYQEHLGPMLNILN